MLHAVERDTSTCLSARWHDRQRRVGIAFFLIVVRNRVGVVVGSGELWCSLQQKVSSCIRLRGKQSGHHRGHCLVDCGAPPWWIHDWRCPSGSRNRVLLPIPNSLAVAFLYAVDVDRLPDRRRQMLAPATSAIWVCECGWRNRDSNAVCGGFGKLGCKKPRPAQGLHPEDLSSQLAEFVLSEAEMPASAAATASEDLPPDAFEMRLLSLLREEPETQPQPQATSSLEEWLRPAQASDTTADSTPPQSPQLQRQYSPSAQEAPEYWTCNCGFRNRMSNAACGGTGHLGCGLPRPGGAGIQPQRPRENLEKGYRAVQEKQVSPAESPAETDSAVGSGALAAGQEGSLSSPPPLGGPWVCTSLLTEHACGGRLPPFWYQVKDGTERLRIGLQGV